MPKSSFEDNLQWTVDKATANNLCEQSPDYTRMLWSKTRCALVVDRITGEVIWMNDKEKARREKRR